MPPYRRGSSPHTRGARRVPPALVRGVWIIPAYAGSTAEAPPAPTTSRDHPRIRGEHTAALIGPAIAGGSSPHTRGAHRRHRHRHPRGGIIPAYAGSTKIMPNLRRISQDHPRIRGEHGRRSDRRADLGGSSPHTRGAQRPAHASDDYVRIIPAYAGSTGRRRRRCRGRRDHPRIRGEHIQDTPLTNVTPGSSPHTRGAPIRRCYRSPSRRIIPAYAGSTRRSAGKSREPGDHPRIRGEHVPEAPVLGADVGSSPHTRGARDDPPQERARGRIIPAYAGSTLYFDKPQTRNWDHPRIRGEHRSVSARSCATVGSSPHTRGARRLRHGDRAGARIIPAYAGSTFWVACG